MTHFEKYLSSYDGSSLRKKYSLDEYGVWKVHGEDPNCDFGGYHYKPYLFTAKGKLRDVINKAVEHPSWYTWGRGGSIDRIEVMEV